MQQPKFRGANIDPAGGGSAVHDAVGRLEHTTQASRAGQMFGLAAFNYPIPLPGSASGDCCLPCFTDLLLPGQPLAGSNVKKLLAALPMPLPSARPGIQTHRPPACFAQGGAREQQSLQVLSLPVSMLMYVGESSNMWTSPDELLVLPTRCARQPDLHLLQ